MFCTNCGTKNNDDSRFCCGCGAPLNGGAPAQAPVQAPYPQDQYQQPYGQYQQPYAQNPYPQQQAVGMRTEEDVNNFFRNVLGLQEKYIGKYQKMVTPLVRSLMSNEVIEFACVGAHNFSMSTGGDMCGYAMTNMRMIISCPGNALRSAANASRGRRTFQGVQSYTYDQINGVSYNKALLTGTITIDFFDGAMTIGVDKKFTEIVHDGISKAIYAHRNGGRF